MTEPVTLIPGVQCLRADNPSPLTGPGTNTYIVGESDIVVIDPGPALDSHFAALLQAIEGRRLQAIVVTHAHRDHSALARRLGLATGAGILAFGGARDGISPRNSALAAEFGDTGEGLDLAFAPDRRLADGDRIIGDTWELRVLHTPGHLGGHICLGLGRTLFSGDHVMGWSSSIVSPPEGDMGDYMASLEQLSGGDWTLALPGHGDPVQDPSARISDLLAHRRMREAQVVAALAGGPASASALARCIYRDLAPALLPAATRNVLAHLLDLSSRNIVTAATRAGPDAVWQLE
jgi:hydroxyacylglutathione hydrolase